MMVKQDNIPVLPTLEWFDQLQKEFLAIQNSQVAQIAKTIMASNAASSYLQCLQSPEIQSLMRCNQHLIQSIYANPAFQAFQDMGNDIAKISNAYRDLFTPAMDLVSQFNQLTRDQLADMVLQESIPLDESLEEVPEMNKEEQIAITAQVKSLFPQSRDFTWDQILNFLTVLVTILNIVMSCMQSDISHQDAVQAHKDAVQAHQDFLDSQKNAHPVQTSSPTTSARKK